MQCTNGKKYIFTCLILLVWLSLMGFVPLYMVDCRISRKLCHACTQACQCPDTQAPEHACTKEHTRPGMGPSAMYAIIVLYVYNQ